MGKGIVEGKSEEKLWEKGGAGTRRPVDCLLGDDHEGNDQGV